MLLMRRLRLRLRRVARDDRGGALVAVVGMGAVMMAMVLVSSSMTVTAFRYSDTTRASVQAEASADAGVAYVAAQMTAGNCTAPYTSASTPVYTVNVSYQRTVSGTSWLTGCPSTAADVNKVKLVSVGSASAWSTVTRTVEAIYNYTPASQPPPIMGSGSAVYGFNQTDLTMTNLTITQSGTSKPGLVFKNLAGSSGTGTLKCQTGSTIQGDVILGNGAFTSPSGCTINGDLWANAGANGVSISGSSTITGSVHATGTASPVVNSSGTVNGNIYSSGPVTVSGNVGGNIVAGPTTGQTSISSTVGGSVVSAGTVAVAKGGKVVGTISQNQSGVAAPVIPTVPGWVDFQYHSASPTDWTTAGFTVTPATACTGTAVAAQIDAAAAPTLIDAMTAPCSGGGVDFTGTTLTLKTDVAVMLGSFTMKSMTVTSAPGTGTHRLWFVSPDNTADGAPTCTAPEAADTMGNQIAFDSTVDFFVYSPCGLSNSGSEMWGQLYSTTVNFNNACTIHYVPVGLPGVNFDTGTYTPPPPPVPGKLSTVFSVRNISG